MTKTRRATSRPTCLANVDLELESHLDLRPLVAELGERVIVLHAGPYDGAYAAFLELNRANDREADDTLRGWLDLIETVSESAREAWFAAKRRDFDVGISAGMEPYMRAFEVPEDTVRRIAALGARLTFTVYAPPRA
jgi:hypothetical protein